MSALILGLCGGCLEFTTAAVVAVYLDNETGGATPYIVCRSCVADLQRDSSAFALSVERNLSAVTGQGTPRRETA